MTQPDMGHQVDDRRKDQHQASEVISGKGRRAGHSASTASARTGGTNKTAFSVTLNPTYNNADVSSSGVKRNTSTLCTVETGWYLPPRFNITMNITGEYCLIFDYQQPLLSRTSVARHLGSETVLAFVGDSNTRRVFEATLSLLGYGGWLKNLTQYAERHWRPHDMRHAVDHTYLCPPTFQIPMPIPMSVPTSMPVSMPLQTEAATSFASTSSINITVGFLWSPLLTKREFFTYRPWSRCHGRCDASDGIRNCDGSIKEGSGDRWACGTLLDSVQLSPGLVGNRTFITVSQAGIHDLLHTGYKLESSSEPTARDFEKVDLKLGQFFQALKSGQPRWDVEAPPTSQQCWRTRWQGGRDILMSPLRSTRLSTGPLIDMLHNQSIKSGVAHDLFDMHLDVYPLTDRLHHDAPAALDGIHYPSIVYEAIAQLLMQQLVESSLS
jgi:hypothetical protein